MNNSMHVFLSVCVLAVNYGFIWYSKGDASLLHYTNIAVLLSLGLVQLSDQVAAIWKK